MTTAPAQQTRRAGAFGSVLVATGLVLFPLLWLVLVIARVLEVQPLMRFLARSDAHVFFDLPGMLGDLRAFPILFTLLPATGAALVTSGLLMRRGRGVVRAALVGLGVGAGVLLLAWVIAP